MSATLAPDRAADLGVPLLAATAVHLLAALVAVATLDLPSPELAAPDQPVVIEAEIIDARALEAAVQRLRDAQAAERRAEAQAAAAIAYATEQQRLDAARLAAESEAAERRAREAVAAKEKAEVARIAREAAAQKQREKELKAQLAAEDRRRKAERAGLMGPYTQAIQQKVMRNWIKPESARAGIECVVKVEQLPTGDVVRATVLACNGDDAVRRSIEDAVLRSSPLPAPPDRSLYERTLEFAFKPSR